MACIVPQLFVYIDIVRELVFIYILVVILHPNFNGELQNVPEQTDNIHQGNMTNADYLEKFKNLLGMESVLKVQIHYQDIVDIVTEEKYRGEIYEIINPQNK